MTDPVDTDALRRDARVLSPGFPSVEKRLNAAADEVDRLRGELHTARAGLSYMADMHERRRVKLERVEPENEHLRAVIENAPHAWDCAQETYEGHDETRPCTCWKADLL